MARQLARVTAGLTLRLKAATVVEIGEPDEDLLAQVLMKLFADRQLYMDDKLVSYIVARMERSLDTAQIIVERLDRWRSLVVHGSAGRWRRRFSLNWARLRKTIDCHSSVVKLLYGL